ncbi:MAG TPA: molybdopterin biosynthesis protein [Anaerolineales bacterium]|jgi:putative molybdopterin biosynthesis protein|nr:molybdopterin biosynthesis protein [Anaerolineales bacterium]
MSIYLHDIPLPEAMSRFSGALIEADLGGILGEEELGLTPQVIGRVLSRPVWAKLSSPHYHAAAMDGFAVRAAETHGATQTSPVVLTYEQQTKYVDTGDLVPDGFNAVIPIENIEPLDSSGEISRHARSPEKIRIREAVAPWAHIRPLGEDMIATQLVLPAGHTLRPVDLGAIAGSGHAAVFVSRKPRVAVIPTGTELVEIGTPVMPGDIIEYNSLVLAAQVEGWGGVAERCAKVDDVFEHILAAVRTAAETHDIILLNAGSSAGSEDFSAQVVEELGELLVHGVAVRPGHPVILGILDAENGRKVPIVGVPGYPVSAALTGEIFVEPVIARWLGRPAYEPEVIDAEITRKITSPGGDDDFQRVVVGRVGDRLLAAPLPRGAGVVSSLVRADGLALIPRGSQGEPAGATVQVRLYRTRAEVERTIFVIGSHDLTLDLLAQFLNSKQRRLTSANVGSLGGLVALRRHEAHLAGSHLLDPVSGEYNLSYLKQYLPEIPVKVIALVNRQQGLIVRKGNPRGIRDLFDLTREDVTFVNRQRGAGTRVLLDYHLDNLGIAIESVRGYAQEEYTHLTVAAAIASGRADCGMGIAAAADALEMEFIPLFEERYDLIVPEEFYQSQLLSPLWDVLDDPRFREAVRSLPGYNIDVMGTIKNIME